MIIDGRALAREVLTRTKARTEKLSQSPRVLAIVVSETAATLSYLSIKSKRAEDAGCVLEIQRFPTDVSTAVLRTAVLTTGADSVIVQLPLPESIDTKEVCDVISVSKDADVLSSSARERFENLGKLNFPKLLPPVVAAVREIFNTYEVDPKGKKVVVIGAGFLVGAPCATWLTQQGAKVSVVTTASGNLTEALKDADIIVSGAGSPHFIKPEMLKDGVVLVDAGTSESNGELAGDADPACADKCSLFTPVPGGIGPLAVACLFENVVTLAENATEN